MMFAADAAVDATIISPCLLFFIDADAIFHASPLPL